jgi:hypothetical protein
VFKHHLAGVDEHLTKESVQFRAYQVDQFVRFFQRVVRIANARRIASDQFFSHFLDALVEEKEEHVEAVDHLSAFAHIVRSQLAANCLKALFLSRIDLRGDILKHLVRIVLAQYRLLQQAAKQKLVRRELEC